MGMYDSVWAVCPECGEPVEFQSKAGDCVLADYDVKEVPIVIANDIEGNVSVCRKCNHLLKISMSSYVPVTVRMMVK
jgi:NMD protein affecting ribosome stability and mRNA decay